MLKAENGYAIFRKIVIHTSYRNLMKLRMNKNNQYIFNHNSKK